MSEKHGTPEAEKALRRAYETALAYLRGAREQSTHVAVTQAEVRARLGTKLPEMGESSDAVIEALVKAADGAFSPSTGGRFFAYVIGGTHPAGVGAEFLNAAWETIAARLQEKKGVLPPNLRVETLYRIYLERLPYYRQARWIVVPETGETPDALALRIRLMIKGALPCAI